MGLFVGKPGSGKTVAAASWCEDNPDSRIFIFDLDGRIRPLVLMYPNRKKNIEFETYGPHDFERLARKMEGLQDRCDYDAVIFDGLTAAGDQAINYMLSLRGSGESTGKKKGILEMAGPEDFGGEARALSIILDIARVLPCHFIMTSHWIVTEMKNITTNKVTVEKQLVTAGKKVAAKVPIYFDEVYFFDPQSPVNLAEPPQYMVRTMAGSDYPAKTALPLPPVIDFTMKPGGTGLYTKIQNILKQHQLKMEKEAKVIKL